MNSFNHSIYLSIYGIYIAPLHCNYSEALPAQAQAKRKVIILRLQSLSFGIVQIIWLTHQIRNQVRHSDHERCFIKYTHCAWIPIAEILMSFSIINLTQSCEFQDLGDHAPWSLSGLDLFANWQIDAHCSPCLLRILLTWYKFVCCGDMHTDWLPSG